MKFTLSHHAYFVEATPEAALKFFEEQVREVLGNVESHPDIVTLHFEQLGIADAHSIKEMQNTKPLNGDRRLFYISFGEITREAQNALLKVLEDPLGDALFFLRSGSWRSLLPTVRSRLMKINLEENGERRAIGVKKLFSKSVRERMETAKAISEKVSEGEVSKSELVKELLCELKDKKFSTRTIQSSVKLVNYLSSKGASVKQILETVALLT